MDEVYELIIITKPTHYLLYIYYITRKLTTDNLENKILLNR